MTLKTVKSENKAARFGVTESCSLVVRQLSSIPVTLEKTFLSTGARLWEISRTSTEIAKNCELTGNLLAEERILSVVEQLKSAMDRVEQYFYHSSAERENVHATVRLMEQSFAAIGLAMLAFQDNVKALNNLRICARIQAAQMDATGFNIAEEIALLIEKIKHGSSQVSGYLVRLSEEITCTNVLLHDMGMRQNSLASTAVHEMRQSAAGLLELHRSQGRIMATVADKTAGITSDIDDIVADMQYHDITRQKIEHVVESLGSLERELAEKIADGHYLGGSAGIEESIHVCELQIAQLGQGKTELQDALCGLHAKLGNIGVSVSSIIKALEDLFGLSTQNEESFILKIESAISRVALALGENRDLHLAMAERMQQVTAIKDDAVVSLGSVRVVGEDIRLIALNAIIKSLQAGERGAALSVIAEEVKGHADKLFTVVHLVNESLRTISASAGALSKGAEQVSQDEQYRNGMHNSLHEFDELPASLRELDSSIVANVKAITKQVRFVQDGVAESTATLDAVPELAELDGVVNGTLQQLIFQLSLLVPHSQEGEGAAVLPGICSNYTMDSERQLHNTVAARRGRLSESGLEDEDMTAGIPANKEEVFDNVFLF